MLKSFVKAVIPQPVRVALRKLPMYARQVIESCREITFRPYITRKAIDTVSFDFFVGDPTGKSWYDSERTFGGVELMFLRDNMIRPGDVIFDVGGHHGWYAIVLCHYVEEHGKVVTFEPNPKNCKIIKRNISLNQLSNVCVENIAIGSQNQDVVVTNVSDTAVKPEKIDNRYRPEHWRRKSVSQGIKVKMKSLDSYADEHNILPSLIKIDVEGYEVEVLRGSRSILASRPKLCLEIHHPDALARYGTSLNDIFELIPLKGYRYWLQVDDNEMPHCVNNLNGVKDIGHRFHIYGIPYS
jgi:FkbM family methyltransferase